MNKTLMMIIAWFMTIWQNTVGGFLAGKRLAATNSSSRRPEKVSDWTDEHRLEYLLETTEPILNVWRPTSEAIIQVIGVLAEFGVTIRVSTPERARKEAGHFRLGLTLIVPGKPALIWINLPFHRKRTRSDDELSDTIVHEAIHASAAVLGRHQTLPDNPVSKAYQIEEICAHIGTSLVQQKVGLPGAAQNRKAARQLGVKLSKTEVELAHAQGQIAADWLLGVGNSIKVSVPTAGEI